MPINPQINDMPWFGKPADPVGAYQQGQNLAEQSQRMKQSADMHPLKMADMKSATAARDASTNLSKQSYEYGQKTMDTRVEGAKHSTSLLGQQVEYGKKTMDFRVADAESLASLRDAQSKVAQGSIEADKDLRRATADLAKTRRDIARDTKESATNAQRAANYDTVLKYNTAKATNKSDIDRSKAISKMTQLQADYASSTQDARVLSGLYGMYHDMASKDHQQWRNNNEFNTHQRNEASRNQMQDDVAFLRAADRNGWLSDVAEFNPHSSLSSDQKQEVLDEKARLMGKAAYSEYTMQKNTSSIQRISMQAGAEKVVNGFKDSVKEEFRTNPDFQVDGVYTSNGLAAIERYKEGLELKAEIGEDEFDRLTAPIPASGVSGPTRSAMMSGKPYTHPTRSKEYLGGSLVIPEENALKEMRKMYAQNQAAYRSQFTPEEASWSKYGIKVTAKSGEVYKREQANEKLDFVAGQLTSDAYLANYETMEEAMSDAFLSADMVMGDVPVIRNPSDVPDLVSRGKLSQGDLYWSETKKSWNRVPTAGQPATTQPATTQPTTGGPPAPPVDPASNAALTQAASIMGKDPNWGNENRMADSIKEISAHIRKLESDIRDSGVKVMNYGKGDIVKVPYGFNKPEISMGMDSSKVQERQYADRHYKPDFETRFFTRDGYYTEGERNQLAQDYKNNSEKILELKEILKSIKGIPPLPR